MHVVFNMIILMDFNISRSIKRQCVEFFKLNTVKNAGNHYFVICHNILQYIAVQFLCIIQLINGHGGPELVIGTS